MAEWPWTSDRQLSAKAADQAFLRTAIRPQPEKTLGRLAVVDLFAGVGGLTLGLAEAARALQLHLDVRLALDTERVAIDVYEANFPGARTSTEDIAEVFDGQVGAPLTKREYELQSVVGAVDVLMGGPPCQGHSAFNNATRHSDERNSLYLRMARAAEVLDPRIVLIENVPGARSDKGQVVTRTEDELRRLGYAVSCGVVDVSTLGVAQRRKRLVVLASKGEKVDVAEVFSRHAQDERSVMWAMEDLIDVDSTELVDQPARSAPETRRRIQFLFEHGLFDLPNEMRPRCHRGNHSYGSVYGRLDPDLPSQTITRGFYSMCMGRYVHPTEARTITAREAARLQSFPDYFDWSAMTKRGDLALAVANAVPMKLSYLIALEAFR